MKNRFSKKQNHCLAAVVFCWQSKKPVFGYSETCGWLEPNFKENTEDTGPFDFFFFFFLFPSSPKVIEGGYILLFTEPIGLENIATSPVEVPDSIKSLKFI